jgi:hypothetical protein
LRQRLHFTAQYGREHRQTQIRPYLLRRYDRFERRFMQRALTLFENSQNSAQKTLASNRSFSISFAAASFGGPSKICEFFVFSGM